jgi:hypothetical protein
MRILKHIIFLTFSLIIFTILLSCSNTKDKSNSNLSANQNTKISDSNTNQFNLAEFERNKELWTSKNIQNYKMIVGASGFLTNFPEEVLIDVKARQVKSVKSLSKTGNNYIEAYKNYNTIEKIFDFIALENSRKADKLIVRFNGEFGYPTDIVLDEQIGSSDDELSLKVRSLEIEK